MSPRWRPLDEDRGPRRIGDALDGVVPGARAFTTLLDRWPELVGDGIAARFRPVGLHDGTLVVATDDGAAIASVRWLEQDLLARLQEAVGAATVTALRFVVRSP
jgi:predicted nucleic acid-binding Zn ribbon protein